MVAVVEMDALGLRRGLDNYSGFFFFFGSCQDIHGWDPDGELWPEGPVCPVLSFLSGCLGGYMESKRWGVEGGHAFLSLVPGNQLGITYETLKMPR